jgi:hypothetical protein
MSMLASPRSRVRERLDQCTVLPWRSHSDRTDEPLFELPILQRSMSFLKLLLQDGAIDLELASSVVALDPGLAYGTLRLANQDLPDDCDRIWQLPLAVVTAGRDALEQLLTTTVQVTPCALSKQAPMEKLISDAVARACVAQLLARELGSPHPRKCFLSGLVLELPAMARLSIPAGLISPAVMVPDMCHSLPAAIVRAVLAHCGEERSPTDTMVAMVLIADAVLRALSSSNPAPRLQELSARSLWRPWGGMSQLQRSGLLNRCCEMARWAAGNVYGMDPWNFMARLERPKAWE